MATRISADVQAGLEWRQYQRVKGFYSLRDSKYRTLLQLLGGNFDSNDLITTVPVTSEQASEIQQTTGRPLKVNRIAVVVRNYKNLLSQPPEIEVPARRDDDGAVTKDSEKHADKIEKLLYATWGANHMEIELQGIVHYTSGLGSCPIKVWPNLDKKLMEYNLIRPWAFYPMTKGNDFRDYRYVCVETPMSGEELLSEDKYRIAMETFNPGLLSDGTIDPDRMYMIVEHSRKDWLALIVGEMYSEDNQIGDEAKDRPPLAQFGPQTIYRIKNILGFIPYLNIPGNYIPHQAMGESDVWQSVGLNLYVNDMLETQADILAFTGNPILVVTGSNVAPSAIPNYPGAAMSFPEQGARAQFLTPPDISGTYLQQIQASMRFIEDQVGQPETLQGRVQPSVESGAAITALLGGVAATVSTKQRVFKVFFEKLNSMTLQGYEKVFRDTELNLQGSVGLFSGDYFAVKMKGKDIDGWTANEVIYREGMQDFGSRLVNTLQMLGAKLISRRTAMKQVGVRSPLEEEALIRAERVEDALLEASSRPQGPNDAQRDRQGLTRGRVPGQGGGPPAGAPSADQMAELMSRLGGAGGPGQATPPPTAGTPPLPGPGPAIDEAEVKRALGREKYIGRVYLLAVDPVVRVAITRENDRVKVERAVADLGVQVQIEVVTTQPEGATRIRGQR